MSLVVVKNLDREHFLFSFQNILGYKTLKETKKGNLIRHRIIIGLFTLLFAFPALAETGGASFYANKFVGRKTASGQIYSHSRMTAAHKTLPFGTKVRVTDPKTGRQVNVTINDRGPFTKGRIIDLSRNAARQLGIEKRGVAKVNVTVLKRTSKKKR